MKATRMGMYVLLTGILTSCFPPSVLTTPPPVEEKKINYDFTPPEQATEKVDIALILLNPNYASGFEQESQVMFTNFIDNMTLDFEEMLIAKGYSIRGPYATYDEIVYSDKSETDLMLGVEIDFSYEWDQGASNSKRMVGYGGVTTGYSYQIDGNLNLGGKINLVIKEALTQEKLWVKSIKLQDKKVLIQTAKYKVKSQTEGEQAIANDPQYKNVMYETLDDYYQNALKTAWNHLDPRELTPLKKQVEELRKKKGY